VFPLVGPKRDRVSAERFIHDIFIGGVSSENRDQFYPHFTCATDTENIRRIFEDVKSTIMAGYMTNTGF